MGGPREVARGAPGYPGRFEALSSPPERIYLEGPWDDKEPLVAIVGSRGATEDGVDVAEGLAADLARRGVAVISGLARGIDAAAHRGALGAGGRSGAVLGTPLDRVYPPRHRELQRRLAESLGILSEHPPGAPVTRATFATRNRLLAALADVVVVVQGHGTSGALLTAGAARGLGRPIGALPWPCYEELGAAPHRLIREGATLVRSADDVVALLPEKRRALLSLRLDFDTQSAGAAPRDARAIVAALPAAERTLWTSLRDRPASLEAVALRAGLSIGEAAAALTALELRDLAARAPGGLVRRRRTPRRRAPAGIPDS